MDWENKVGDYAPDASFDDVVGAIAPPQQSIKIASHQTLQYLDQNDSYDFNFDEKSETIWGEAQQIANLFGCTEDNIYLHVKNIISDGELTEDSSVKEHKRLSSMKLALEKAKSKTIDKK